MGELQVKLLSSPAEVLLDGESLSHLSTGKALGLIAFLAVEGGVHSRSEIATLLWGESLERAARSSLRQMLKRLRDALGSAIRVDRHEVELIGPYHCDVWDFHDAASSNSPATLEYGVNDFMRGVDVHRAPGLERWIDGTARELQNRFDTAAQAIGRDATARSDWAAVLKCSAGWLKTSPHSSEAMHLAMEALFMSGRIEEALSKFHLFSKTYFADMGFDVPGSIKTLARKIELAGQSNVSVGDRERSVPVFESSLVGRSKEWGQLIEGWQAVENGIGQVFLVEGEEGVGKSRLVGDFCRWALTEGALILRGRGYDAKTGIPYGPVADALREVLDEPALAGAPPSSLAEATIILPELKERFQGLNPASDPGDTGRRSRLFESLSQIMLALSDDQAVVLFVDDLQWCDSETCSLLHFLTRRLRNSRTAIVLGITSGKIDRDSQAARLSRAVKAEMRTSVISLSPLGIEHTTELLHLMGKIQSDTGGSRLAARIQEITDGNPFYTIEILKTLFQNKMLEVDVATGEWVTNRTIDASDRQRIELPRTVRAAVAARVDVLPYELRDLVATIAVSGRGIVVDTIASVHGASRLRIAALIDALVERLLVIERDGRYYAAHQIIADAVRQSLTKSRRRQVHAAIALAMETNCKRDSEPDVAGEIARHADIGHESELAYRWGLKASEAALARFANNEALSWLDISAHHAGTEEEKTDVNQRTAELMEIEGIPHSEREFQRGSYGEGLTIQDVDLRVRSSTPRH